MSLAFVRVFAATLLFLMLVAAPARALTASDVMDNMEPKERVGFLGGAVSMAAHLFAANGNRAKGECALSWFFGADAEDTRRQVYRFYDAHKDKDPVILLAILIDRQCGK